MQILTQNLLPYIRDSNVLFGLDFCMFKREN